MIPRTPKAAQPDAPSPSPNDSNVERPVSASHVTVTTTGAESTGPPLFASCPIHGVNAG